jgi:hypothetical protein
VSAASACTHTRHSRSAWRACRVCETADVILEVLDARDPLGCRCPAVERMLQGKLSQVRPARPHAEAHRAAQGKGAPKRVILVLNKIGAQSPPPSRRSRLADATAADLVPADVVSRWIKYFRREFPVIAFKASTQQQKGAGAACGPLSAREVKTALAGQGSATAPSPPLSRPKTTWRAARCRARSPCKLLGAQLTGSDCAAHSASAALRS